MKDEEKDNDEEDKDDEEDKEDNDEEVGNEEADNEKEEDDEIEKKKNVANDIFGDSDSEDEDYKSIGNKRKHVSESSENEDSEDDFFKKKKKSTVIRDSDEEESDDEDDNLDRKKKSRQKQDDDDENEEKDSDLDENDLQDKKSDAEDDDKNETVDNDDKNKDILPDISSSDSSGDEREGKSKRSNDFIYDFDLMLAKRKEQNARNRRRKNNSDIINDSDDFIADLITKMKQAAEDDFELNKERKAATHKMKLLPQVQNYLRKIDLRESFLDSGVLSVITDWLTPLPDRSLPNLQVRESLLRILLELNIMDVDRLKSSSIGKAVMYLFKHPKETKENKRLAAKLISNWSRPIFNCETDYQAISKEDREERDYANMHKVRKLSSDPSNSQSSSNSSQQQQTTLIKPGEKGKSKN